MGVHQLRVEPQAFRVRHARLPRNPEFRLEVVGNLGHLAV